METDVKSLNIGEKATLEFKRPEEYEIVIADDPSNKRYISDTATVVEVLEDLTVRFAFASMEINPKYYSFALRYNDLQMEENKTFMQKKFKEGDQIEAVGYSLRNDDLKDLSAKLVITYSPWSGRQKQRAVFMKKGILRKRGRTYRTWKARYFTLDETSLKWFENENAKKHQGGIYLHQINSVHINEHESNTAVAFYFSVTVPGRELELQADSEGIGKEWMEAINTLCRLRRAEILYESEMDSSIDPSLVHYNDQSRETIEISSPFNPAHRSHITTDWIWTGEAFALDENTPLGIG